MSSILSLWARGQGHRIGIAIASHPSTDGNVEALEPIHYHFKGGRLPQNVKRRLEDIVQERSGGICGIVVSWPLQKDTGHMGASCGRTIHVVEELLNDTEIFSQDRPLCFWDSEHPRRCDADTWGRCAEYSRTSSKHEHLASLEQYSQDENIAATQVWDDFVRVHWPIIYQQQERYSSPFHQGYTDDYRADEEFAF